MILVAFFTLKGAINDIRHFAQPSWLVGWLVGFGASVLKTFSNTFRLLFRNNNNRAAISFKSTTADQMAMGSFQLNLNVGLGVRRPIFFKFCPKIDGY